MIKFLRVLRLKLKLRAYVKKLKPAQQAWAKDLFERLNSVPIQKRIQVLQNEIELQKNLHAKISERIARL